MPDPYLAQLVRCPSCGGPAEPEEEDGVFKHVCPCGFEFGFRRLEQDADSCSLGIPETVRRGHEAPPQGQPVFLGSSIGRRPE